MKVLNWFLCIVLLIVLPPNIYYHEWHNTLVCFGIGFALRSQIPLLFTDKEKENG